MGFIWFIILIFVWIYIYSYGHMKKACMKILRILVNQKGLTQEEYNSINEKVYGKNANNVIVKPVEKTVTNTAITEQEVVIKRPTVQNIAEEREKKRQNNISGVLYLGVILIMLAGIVFATTTWDYLPGVIKALLLFGFSSMLFGASNLSEKKLKLEKTAFALWVLGALFFPITCISAGYLEVFGNYFSLNSEGKYLFSLFSAIVCLPIYIVGAKKYISKAISYIGAINITLIAYFMFLNISDKTDILLIAMGAYNLIVLAILTNIKTKSKLSENMTDSMLVVSKIVLGIITIISIINTSMSNAVSIAYLINYLIIIGNYKYICIKQKSYLFSTVTVITSIAFLSSIYSYFNQNNLLVNVEYATFMFISMAGISSIIQGIAINVIKSEKWDGLKLLMNTTTLIFMTLITFTSIEKILEYGNETYQALFFAIVTLTLFVQIRFNFRKVQTGLIQFVDVLICIFSVLVPYTIYRYIPEASQMNFTLYISIICFIPWIISKIYNAISKSENTSIYKIVGTVFLIIPFVSSFIEVKPEIAIFKFLLALMLIFVAFTNYYDYLKNSKQYKEFRGILLNISFITITAPIFIVLTAWLTMIPLYFTTFIAAVIIYLISMLDESGKLLEKSKWYVLLMLILSNMLMMVNITGILEYIFMQAMLIVLYFNTIFRKSIFYNIYFLFALVLNTIVLVELQSITDEIRNIFNILVLLIISGINIYGYYSLKSNESTGKDLIANKFILTFGLLIGLVPYITIISYISDLLDISSVVNMILIQIPIIFVVFAIEKLIYRIRNVFTYIVQIIIYFIATVTVYEINDILLYSTVLLILVIFGSAIKNKSMFLIPSIFLIIFVLKGTADFWTSIPWWLYLLVGGSSLVYVAMRREINKEKDIDEKRTSKFKQFMSNFEE